jgi:hypothetical protein
VDYTFKIGTVLKASVIVSKSAAKPSGDPYQGILHEGEGSVQLTSSLGWLVS